MDLDPRVLSTATMAVAGGVLLFAGAAKIYDRRSFVRLLVVSFRLRAGFAALLAAVVPVAEAIVGTLLVLGVRTAVIAPIAGLSFLLFAGAIAWLQVTRPGARCGCFGSRGTASWSMVFRNLGLAALCVVPIAPRSTVAWVCLGAGAVLGSFVSGRLHQEAARQ